MFAEITYKMDLVTHILTGELVYKATNLNLVRAAVYTGCIVPDLGEIMIQKALAQKFGAKVAVYDERTSDVGIASELNVTYLYDLLHSPFFSIFILLIGLNAFNLMSARASAIVLSFGIGLFSHFLLDSFTHGTVWALKLFFPFSNKRFPILEDSIGNWWDWQPVVRLPFLEFPFPVVCVGVWVCLLLASQLIKF